ncbi:structural maintenance of chromosomes protein 6-like [Uloborus diversus]|uniref:structural maintenance of chromosomes protein 6-like n=1 Tax=Uloborus diversus TaxID=327109 RepID=UPI00240A829D|nr:structural maintenance of chromosomes protein 6-like [Uloborus diversus]
MKRLSSENGQQASKRKKYFEEPGDLGIIESVSLRNFMCHENLKFDFDPHMNFIVGLNGSGKSAILTGIILALGGKSSSTGRYANIKGFIKTGKQSATASVVLKNSGISSYKPEEFGNKITVERTLNADGVSQYKLKSETGRIVSTSKEELKNILDTMDIKIENPVTVLTQEISRNFLLQMKPDKLFAVSIV